ncbi:MAG: helix-turn-helix domain-containing protein, partial [Eggerthellaceae bacterium]|nr:helix-turn-helix domain-containing protein [Eggerthellaceae bacterium]
MKLTGNSICCLLDRDFKQVECDDRSRLLRVDYPMLYDPSADMVGHAVIVPDFELPCGGETMRGSLCLCVSDSSANAARENGCAVIIVRDDVPFRHVYNQVQARFMAFDRWDAQMRAYVDTYAGFQVLVASCAADAGFSCSIIDAQYRTIYHANARRAGARAVAGDADERVVAGARAVAGAAGGGSERAVADSSSKRAMNDGCAAADTVVKNAVPSVGSERVAAGSVVEDAAAGAGVIRAAIDATSEGLVAGPVDTYAAVSSAGDPTREMLSEDAIELLMASSEYRRLRESRMAFEVPGSNGLMMRNIFYNGGVVGALVLRYDPQLDSTVYVRFLVEHLARYIEIMYVRLGSFGAALVKPSLLKSAFKHLLEGDLEDVGSLSRMLVADGHEKDAQYVLLQVDRSFTNEKTSEYEYLIRRLEIDLPGSYSAVANGYIYALVDFSAYAKVIGRDFWHDIPIVLRELLLKAGVSRPFTTMEHLMGAQMQAEIALRQGTMRDPMFWCYRFDDYALSWVLSHGVGDMPAEYIAHPVIEVLRSYDAENGTQLLRSLAVFVRCRYNVSEASRELYVARSTLLNRLARINEMSPVNLERSETRLYLGISLM